MAEVLPIRPMMGGAWAEDTVPEPPAGLSEEAAGIWRGVVEAWVVGPDALPLLRLACEAWDRYREAASILAKDGPVVTNPKSGAIRQHPCHAIARDNLTAVRQAFRQLKLEPPEVA